jgi:hypothetical protein
MLAGVTAIAGAAAQTGTAAAASAVHTKRLVLHQTATHRVGKYSFTGTDTARSAVSQKIVGYDTISGHFYPKTNSLKIHVALSLKGGLIVARLHGIGANQYTGTITKGAGKYNGVTGTITAHSPTQNSKKTFVNLTYHL